MDCSDNLENKPIQYSLYDYKKGLCGPELLSL